MSKILSQSFFLTVIVLSLLSGCATRSGNFVKMIPDNQVTQAFESFTVIPEYHYYYYGPVSFPRAFVGISKDFTMDSSLWKPIDLTSKNLRDWIWVRASADRGSIDPNRYGANITGPGGEHIGVWYSLEDSLQWARIMLKDNKTITIGMPVNDNKIPRERFFSHDD